MKNVSCGVIVTDGNVLLLGHVTKQRHWDIPKGLKEEGESELDAALRELKEETGILALPDQLLPLGRITYTREKDLSLFLYRMPELPDVKSLFCSTYVDIEGVTPFLEFDRYKYMTWEDAVFCTAKTMSEKLLTLSQSLKS